MLANDAVSSSKFPPDVTNLFQPGPPLQYKRPVGYPLHQRQTCPHITGVSGILRHVQSYLEEHPHGSSNGHLAKLDDAANASKEHAQLLQLHLSQWNPHEDPNVKNTDPYRTLFVARLPYEATEVDLQKVFSQFGDIEKVRIVKNKKTPAVSKGYAFIVFTDPRSCKIACKEIGTHRGVEIGGRVCIVDIERGRTMRYFKPRRLGGGLGGRGYSTNHHHHHYPASRTRFAAPRRPEVAKPYTGPSRFSQSTVPATVTTTYRSRTSRIHNAKPAKQDIDY